jgi:hypothetical protein
MSVLDLCAVPLVVWLNEKRVLMRDIQERLVAVNPRVYRLETVVRLPQFLPPLRG